jgi:hypothetical protein
VGRRLNRVDLIIAFVLVFVAQMAENARSCMTPKGLAREPLRRSGFNMHCSCMGGALACATSDDDSEA